MTGDAGGGPLRLHAVVREPLAGRARRRLGSDEAETDAEVGDSEAGPDGGPEGMEGTRRVTRDGLAAVVSVADEAGEFPDADAGLDRHTRIVDALADSGAVVPAPPGVSAADEEAVRAFLRRGRTALEEALDLFDGACEMRLHVRRHPGRRSTDRPRRPGDHVEVGAAATALYHRLRRHARASRRLPVDGDDVLTAAFLVPRAGWSEGRGLAARWQDQQPGLAAQLTGPWAPYDFVRMFPVEAP